MTGGGSSGSDVSQAVSEASVFPIVVCITLTGIMANTLVGPVLPDIADDLGASTGQVGLLMAAATAPGIVLAPLIGVLADRFGRREVVVPCLIIFGTTGGLAAFAPNFEALVAFRLLQGIGSAGLINLAVVIIIDTWDGVDRARMIGRNAAALTSFIVVLPPLGGGLASLFGWRAVFVPFWLGLLTALLVSAGLPRSPRRDGTLRSQLQATGPALRSWSVLGPMVLGFCVFALIFGLFLTTMPLYLDDEFGLSAAGRGLVAALPAVMSTVGALSLGRLKARYGTRLLIGVGLVIFTAGFSVIAAIPTLLAACAGALLYGAGDGLLIACLQDRVADAAPAESRGAVVATWVGFARAGQTAGPIASGAAYDSVGPRGVFAAGAGLAAALALGHRALVGRGRVLAASMQR